MMASSLMNKIKPSKLWIIPAFMLCSVIFFQMVKPYFSQTYFHFDGFTYKQEAQQVHKTLYSSRSGPAIEVLKQEDSMTVFVNDLQYLIHQTNNQNMIKSYSVTYPSGRIYKVESHGGLLMSYDENGNWIVEFTITMDNGQKIDPFIDVYFPSALVVAAYPEYHTKQGQPTLLLLAFGLLLFGWSSFMYKRFQLLLFHLSFYWIWVEEAEPSDFYFFYCKLSGVLIMIGALIVGFMSFTL